MQAAEQRRRSMVLRIGIVVVYIILLLVFASMSMAWLVGFLLVSMALFSIGGVLFMVLREHHEPEEHYIPSAPGSSPLPDTDNSGE
jgi:hypothetical protein